MSGENADELAGHFDTDLFRLHGPDGLDSNYEGLTQYFESLRDAFDDRSIRRGVIVVDRDVVACQTIIEGRFVRPFTHSPVGTLPPNQQPIVMDLMNLFRFDGQGRLVDEFVMTDNRSLLRQLGAEGR